MSASSPGNFVKRHPEGERLRNQRSVWRPRRRCLPAGNGREFRVTLRAHMQLKLFRRVVERKLMAVGATNEVRSHAAEKGDREWQTISLFIMKEHAATCKFYHDVGETCVLFLFFRSLSFVIAPNLSRPNLSGRQIESRH